MYGEKLPFIFTDEADKQISDRDFQLRIPKFLDSKARLLSVLASEGHFPSGFGMNWDALLDCLRDFCWIDAKRIIVIHEDLPLANKEEEEDLSIYIDILATAVNDWKIVRKGPFAEPSLPMPFIEHELIIIFPSQYEAFTTKLYREISNSNN